MCFAGSGLTEVTFPTSVKVVGHEAFYDCKQLHHAELNEGLAVLGEKFDSGGKEYNGMAFAKSGIESIRIPSSLKTIETTTFMECKSLKTVEFSEGPEKIGVGAFGKYGIESVVLPSSVRTISG